MNAFPNGTRVFFWDGNGTVQHAIVNATARLADGSQVADIAVEGTGAVVRLPIGSLHRAT